MASGETRSRESVFAELFSKRRAFEASRLRLNKTLKQWITGDAPDEVVDAALSEIAVTLQALREEVVAHRDAPREPPITDAFSD